MCTNVAHALGKIVATELFIRFSSSATYFPYNLAEPPYNVAEPPYNLAEPTYRLDELPHNLAKQPYNLT